MSDNINSLGLLGGGTSSGITRSTSFDIVVKKAYTPPSWSTGTDAEILEAVQKLDSGELTVNDLNWQVGDSRSVSLSSFQTYSSSTSSTATQNAQTAQLVILNIGGKTFNGNGTSLDSKTCHYVVGFKDNVCKSYWGASNNTYSSSLIKTVENNVYNALPSDVKACFKKFDVVTGTYSSGSTSGGANATTQQYFTSPAEKEIFGSITYSTSNEANALSQFTYYATANNRKHRNIAEYWYERSPYYGFSNSACRVLSGGTADYISIGGSALGVSPFGCI